jgi:hypothetical protein
MRVLQADDKSIDTVFPGVRTDYTGLAYREGRTGTGEAIKVVATDSRKFERSDGTFAQNTLHVRVTEEDGTTYNAGERK